MATQDILITPHRNDPSYYPTINFTGASTGTIRLEVLPNGTVSFMGNNGALFSIVDDASGSLMSVNNISGLPIFEVWSYDQVDVHGLLNIDGSAQAKQLSILTYPKNPSDAVYKYYVDSSFALISSVSASMGAFATNASVNLAFLTNPSLGYVSQLLAVVNTSVGIITSRHNITETSLGFITSLVSALNTSTGLYATNASVNAALSSNASLGYVSQMVSVLNTSMGVITGRVNVTETSLGLVTSLVFSLNTSIGQYATNASVNLALGNYIKSASLGSGFSWNSGTNQWDVSGGGGKDPSINALYGLVYDISTQVGGVDYTSNLFINDNDSHKTSISNLDQIMGLIAPAKPLMLTGVDLSLGTSATWTTTKYSAKLPSGLASSWYTEASNGTVINNYITDAQFRYYTPSYGYTTNGAFRAGLFQDPCTMGILTVRINSSDYANIVIPAWGTANVSVNSADVSGNFVCSSTSGYGGAANNFWRKAEAYLDVTRQKPGLVKYAIKHSEALTSNDVSLYFDDINSTPVFTKNASTVEGTPVTVWLSGIAHYGVNSTFVVSASLGSGIFYKAYHPTNVVTLTSSAGTTINVNPSSVPDASATFDVSTLFTFNTANYSSGSAAGTIVVTPYKPTGAGSTSTATVNRRVDTYATNRATTTVEYFTDESRRILDGSSGTDLAWDSSNYSQFTANGSYGQVRNGTLTYPVSADYGGTSFTGDKFYMRRFTKASAGSGALTFVGFNPLTGLSAYGSGNVNAFIWLTDQGLFFDLGRAFGIGGGSGSTLATGISAYSSLTSSAINWTLGTYSTGNEVAHNGTYVFIMIFRNGTSTATQITSS